jgi:2,5-diamino-6-(ribosylamino)-4(3H)-pyrimidinone 5'-phosphate reductase
MDRRPYVIINAAMSADGKLSTTERRQVRISGTEDFARVDRLRAECDAVMVGIGTVLADNPSLRLKNADLAAARTARGLDEQPMRVVIDSLARTPPDGDLFRKGSGRRVIFVSSKAPEERIAGLSKHAIVIRAGDTAVNLDKVLDILYGMGVRKLMVEGGATLLWSFVSQGLFDEIRIYVGALIIGGKNAPTLIDGHGFTKEDEFPKLVLKDAERMDDGILLIWEKRF